MYLSAVVLALFDIAVVKTKCHILPHLIFVASSPSLMLKYFLPSLSVCCKRLRQLHILFLAPVMSTSLGAHWDSFDVVVHSLMLLLLFSAVGKHKMWGLLLQAALSAPILILLFSLLFQTTSHTFNLYWNGVSTCRIIFDESIERFIKFNVKISHSQWHQSNIEISLKHQR